MRSLKSECLDRVIFFGEPSLRRALREFGEHFHHERNHQGLGNRIIDAGTEVGRTQGVSPPGRKCTKVAGLKMRRAIFYANLHHFVEVYLIED